MGANIQIESKVLAWNYRQALASIAPCLGLGAPFKSFPIISIKDLQWKYPLQNENSLAISKVKFQV